MPSTATWRSSRWARAAAGDPILPRGAGVPPGETPQRGRASGDRRPDGGQRRAPRGAGRGVRVGLSVDRRALEDRRGKWSRALDLVAARRQPDRRSRGGARAGRPPDAHGGAGGRDGAAATRDPQADHRRQLMTACDLVRAHGIPNLKCYFMIGQPTETSEDVEAIPALAGRMLEHLRVLDPKI